MFKKIKLNCMFYELQSIKYASTQDEILKKMMKGTGDGLGKL